VEAGYNMDMYAPVFVRVEPDGGQHTFILSYSDMKVSSWLDAYLLGKRIGSEKGPIGQFRFNERVIDVDSMVGVRAKLGETHVLLVSGPVYEKAMSSAK
jgi:hypothetical protein